MEVSSLKLGLWQDILHSCKLELNQSSTCSIMWGSILTITKFNVQIPSGFCKLVSYTDDQSPECNDRSFQQNCRQVQDHLSRNISPTKNNPERVQSHDQVNSSNKFFTSNRKHIKTSWAESLKHYIIILGLLVELKIRKKKHTHILSHRTLLEGFHHIYFFKIFWNF